MKYKVNEYVFGGFDFIDSTNNQLVGYVNSILTGNSYQANYAEYRKITLFLKLLNEIQNREIP